MAEKVAGTEFEAAKKQFDKSLFPWALSEELANLRSTIVEQISQSPEASERLDELETKCREASSALEKAFAGFRSSDFGRALSAHGMEAIQEYVYATQRLISLGIIDALKRSPRSYTDNIIGQQLKNIQRTLEVHADFVIVDENIISKPGSMLEPAISPSEKILRQTWSTIESNAPKITKQTTISVSDYEPYLIQERFGIPRKEAINKFYIEIVTLVSGGVFKNERRLDDKREPT